MTELTASFIDFWSLQNVHRYLPILLCSEYQVRPSASCPPVYIYLSLSYTLFPDIIFPVGEDFSPEVQILRKIGCMKCGISFPCVSSTNVTTRPKSMKE